MASRTDLVAEDHLSQILKEAEDVVIVFNVVDQPLRPWLLRQQPQFSLNSFELTRRELVLGMRGGRCHTL